MGWKKMKAWLRRKELAYLGIWQEKNSVYMVMLAPGGTDGYEIVWQNQVTEDLPAEELLEKASLLAASQHKENIVCCLGLSQQEVYFYEKLFPEITSKELAQAVKLDFISAAAWQEPYLWSYVRLPDGNLRIGGMRKKDMQRRTRACREFFDVVEGVLACRGEVPANVCLPEMWASWCVGMQEAFYAAVCGMQRQGLRLGGMPEYKYQWDWLRAAKILWCAGAAVCLLTAGVGWYMVSQADEEMDFKQHELQLLGDVAERQDAIAQDKAVIAGRNKLLAELQDTDAPAYSMLVSLGTSVEDGIWLTGVKLLEDGEVELAGRAAAYNHVAQLLEKLNVRGEGADSAKQEGMVLDTVDRGQDGLLDFQLKGRML